MLLEIQKNFQKLWMVENIFFIYVSIQEVFMTTLDRTGLCQIKIPEGTSQFDQLKKLPNESVLVVNGTVIPRPEGQENQRMETGEIEVELESVEEVIKADPNLPFQQSKHLTAKEQLRLQFRYLDLRRPELQYNLAIRSALTMKMREFLTSKKFLDIETPTLFRRTPGGAKVWFGRIVTQNGKNATILGTIIKGRGKPFESKLPVCKHWPVEDLQAQFEFKSLVLIFTFR